MINKDKGLAQLIADLPVPINDYNMNVGNNSTFLDIGSGFGKPVFHAAMQTGCFSKGVEVVPARVAACESQKYDFEEYYRKLIQKNNDKIVAKKTKR